MWSFFKNIFQMLFGPKRGITLKELVLDSPQEIAKYMFRNFKYLREFDHKNFWKSPEQLNEERSGDCEDFATFAVTMLKKIGYSNSFVLGIWSSNKGHAVACFEQNHGYDVIDVAELKVLHEEASLEACITKLMPDWDHAGILIRQGSEGKVIKEIHRSPSMT